MNRPRKDGEDENINAILIKETLQGLEIGQVDNMRNSALIKASTNHQTNQSKSRQNHDPHSSTQKRKALIMSFAARGATPREHASIDSLSNS